MARTLAERAAEIGHEGEVYRPHPGNRGIWRPRCSCGYNPGLVNTSKSDATTRLNEHYRAALADDATPNSAVQS